MEDFSRNGQAIDTIGLMLVMADVYVLYIRVGAVPSNSWRGMAVTGDAKRGTVMAGYSRTRDVRVQAMVEEVF